MIADMDLTFNETAGENEVEALLSEATKDGKIGTLEVSQVAVGTIIKSQLLLYLFYHIVIV